MPERDDYPADHQRTSRAEESIGEKSAGDLHAVSERRVCAVEVRRVAVAPMHPVDEIEHEQRAHSVVREALPHLDAEEQPKPARMS